MLARLAERTYESLFGNPAILYLRTRGFASPDLSGFAIIGDKFYVPVSGLPLLETVN
jgi:hypothetical protein